MNYTPASPTFEAMRDGAIVCNSGHFDLELNLVGLKSVSTDVRKVRQWVEAYKLRDGREIMVLGEGRTENISGGAIVDSFLPYQLHIYEAGAVGSSPQVPEPTGVMLLGVTLGGWAMRRGRRATV